jgi:hypothetical protein
MTPTVYAFNNKYIVILFIHFTILQSITFFFLKTNLYGMLKSGGGS